MTQRTADPKVLPLIHQRWSPRAFDASPVNEDDLRVMFEAAGWAPSAFNLQPWTFLFAVRGDANWERFLSILIPFNASWVKEAGALVFLLSRTTQGSGDEVKPSHSHSFDAGAAWAMLSLQALNMGYHTHAMVGIDFDAAKRELAVPDDHKIEAAIAIGRKGNPATLPEALQAREAPSGRKPVSEIAFAGSYPAG